MNHRCFAFLVSVVLFALLLLDKPRFAPVRGQVIEPIIPTPASQEISPRAVPDAPTTTTLNWIAPVGNEQIYSVASGVVVLEVSATSDTNPISLVTFSRWDAVTNQWVVIDFTEVAPYQVNLDVSTLNPGQNQINATAAVFNEPGVTKHIWIDKQTVFSCNNVTEIPKSECEALVAFYNSTNGPSWTDRSGWLVTNTPCSWVYVACLNGHVDSLDPDLNHLTGSLPAELGNLSRLDWFSVSENQIIGSLPATLGNLTQVTYLYLDHNAFSGALPSSLTQLTLDTFWFDATNLCEPSDAAFQNWLASIPNLRRMNVPCSAPPTNTPTNTPKPPTNTPTATKTSTPQPTATKTPLPTSPSTATPPQTPTKTATATPTATSTVFCNNINQIPKVECEALVALYNSTNGPGWKNKSGWLVTNTPCSWYGVTCSNNHVTDLRLQSNQLSGSIPAQLGNLTNLRFLDFYNNQLSGSIPAQLGDLTNLIWFVLSSNQLSGSIPPQLGSLTNLSVLGLNSNRLTGSIPPELGNITNLTGLWLNDNQLNGSIPTRLGNLANLEGLALSNNQLSGSLPAELGSLTKLISFSLDNNQFSGALPASLVNLKLNVFYFYNTYLCEPPDTTFQNWLTSIPNLRRTNVKCASASSISGRVTDGPFSQVQLAVDARREWQDTGIAVQTGDQVQVTYVAGTWTIWKGVDPYTDANGQVGRTNECASPLPSANIGGLVGRVSTGAVQFFGNSGSLVAQNSGTLQLSMNDCTGHFQDNDGTLTVQVTVTPASNHPIVGVTISDNAGHTATTDASGNYTLSNLAAGTYTLTPSKSGYTFSPVSRSVSVPPDAPNVNFTGTPPPMNRVPVANDQTITTAQDTPVNITLTASDADGDPLTYSIVSNPANGQLTGTAPNLTYTPNAGFSGSDSFTFKANDGKADSNIAMVSITVSPVQPQIDLRIDSITPVQVLEGQDLVKDKATAVKVVVRKTGNEAVNDVSVQINLGSFALRRFMVAERSNMDPTTHALKADNTMYPLNFATHEVTKTIYFFSDNLTPTGDTYQALANVDDVEAITEITETNNVTPLPSVPVRDIHWGLPYNLYIHYFPADWGSTNLSGFDSFYQANNEFLKSVYPVSDQRFTPDKSTSIYDTTSYRGDNGRLDQYEIGKWMHWGLIGMRLSNPTADRYIATVPTDWFNNTTIFTQNAGIHISDFGPQPGLHELIIVEARPYLFFNVAHEVGHSYGLEYGSPNGCREEYDIICGGPPERVGNAAAPGMWVDKQIPIQVPNARQAYCFMGTYTNTVGVEYWVDVNDYSQLNRESFLLDIRDALAPTTQAILVSGTFNNNNTVTLDNWYVLPEAELSTLTPGPYIFEYQNASDNVLYQQSFDISYTWAGGTLTQVPFAFTIPYVPGTTKIVIKHDNVPLTQKIVSLNAPTVTVIAPNGGEQFSEKATIRWSANDVDGNALSYVLLFSRNNGASWETIDINQTTTGYTWDISKMPIGAQYLIKLIVTDGINTGEDVSNAAFTIHKGIYLPLILRN